LESDEANNLTIEELYNFKLKDILCNFEEKNFYSLRHNNMYSPGWNNNKLLILKNK
tara:strand:- start:443 stop:610 length:168 start_codon:yes stop_codon:yes gene_type:complete